MLTIILIIISVLVLVVSIYFSSKKIRDKAINTKLKVSQNEVAKVNDDLKKNQINESYISEDRIKAIKAKFISTQNIEIIEKEATKEDIDNFYKNQVDNKELNKKLEK